MAIGGLGGGSHLVMTIKTKFDDKLLVLRLEGREQLGRMGEYRVDLVAKVDDDIDIHKLLGTRANVKMDLHDDPRHFNGFVVRMVRGERHGRYQSFTMTMRPWLWFATRTKNSMMFPEKNVKEIITDVLKPYSTDVDWRLESESVYPKLDYCVQYNETDFDFVSRLMEEAGIYYFFEHTETKHTMVFTDSLPKHKSKKTSDKVKWANSLKHEATITNWTKQEEVRSIAAEVWDHDYLSTVVAKAGSTTTPKIKATKTTPPTKAASMLGKGEVYEYPAGVVQNQIKPDAQPATDAATQRAKVLLEGLASMQLYHTGLTNARDIAVGATFELSEDAGGLLSGLFGSDTSSRAGKYLVVGATYRAEFADHEAIEDIKSIQKRRDGFTADVVVIAADGAPFRPERSTPRPVIRGPLTATVVGASGNEIETDKHGRVKVQFHWDRKGENDQKSSCWVRVMQPSAGKGFGFFTLPRVGQEVVVNFIDGNPDRPLIVGSVYNDINTVAYELPKRATVSGWRTHSSKEGDDKMFNELRFDDEKTKEYVWLQAQKDFYRSVKENAFDMVLKNETVKVKLTRKEVIGENWYVNVGKDVMHEFGKDLHVKVAADIFYTGGATLQLKVKQDFSAAVGGDIGVAAENVQIKAKTDIRAGADNIDIKADTNVTIQAGGSGKITLKAGGSTIVLGSDGISIVGSIVKINSGGGGGAAKAASPKDPTEAKNQEELTPGKETDYDKLFEDPTITAKDKAGGGGAAS